MNEILIYSHPDCLLKENGLNHPERPERLKTVLKSIKDMKSSKIKFTSFSNSSIKNHLSKYAFSSSTRAIYPGESE